MLKPPDDIIIPLDGKISLAKEPNQYRMHKPPAKPSKAKADPKATAAQEERHEALKRKGRIVRVGSNGVTIFKGDRW
jgi:hypothetical protein